MPRPWSRNEVEAVVAEYFAMLGMDFRGEPINKSARHRSLAPLLEGRNEDAIYYKHRNISAILVEAGYPFVRGYAPMSNYQWLLAEVVLLRLADSTELEATIAADVELAPPSQSVTAQGLLEAFVSAPTPDRARDRYREQTQEPKRLRVISARVDYLEREARLRSLGLAGEQFVVDLEQLRLERAGKGQLASKVEHVSQTKGDGLGFDVLSYDEDGRERFIEVKTTKYPKETPFFVSQPEVAFSAREHARYQLYRVFDFRGRAKVFTLPGSLEVSCVLAPSVYRASVA